MFTEYVHSLREEFAGYNGKKLARDLMAGLTVTAVALPLALAFGVSSGATAAAGLITAIIAGLAMSLLSGGSYQISGPTGAMTAILISVIGGYGMQGMFLATFMAGILLLACGVFKIGKLVSFIPMPVITGFTSGIAIIIALGQVDNFFGVTSQGDTAVQKLLSYGTLGFHPNIQAVVLGVMAMVIMLLWPKKLNAKFPGSLLAIIIVTVFSIVMKWQVPLVGEIPRTLLPDERLQLLQIDPSAIGGLMMPAVSIAALAMIESLLCGACGSRMMGKPLLADMELISQGIGNMLIPLFGGVPATAAIARTSVAIKSGCVTRLTGVFHAVGLLISMFVLGDVMSQIPLSALAGVLMVTAWRMNEWETIRYIFGGNFKSPKMKFLVTMVATVVFDLTVAIVIGVLFSVLVVIVKLSDVEVSGEKVDIDRLKWCDDSEAFPTTVVVYITGPVFFGCLDKVKEKVDQYVDAQWIIFSMRGVSMMDTSSIQALEEFYQQMQSEGKHVLFAGVQPKVMLTMERAGIHKLVGEENFYWDVEQALKDHQADAMKK